MKHDSAIIYTFRQVIKNATAFSEAQKQIHTVLPGLESVPDPTHKTNPITRVYPLNRGSTVYQ